jgi:DNA-binding MarR family transcriptional regulator
MAFHENLGMRLRGAYLTLHRFTNAHFRQFGLTSDQFVLLGLLDEEDGITQQELTRRSYSDPNTIGAMLRTLESRGWVAREVHPEDRRAWKVMLTEDGRATIGVLKQSMEEFERRFQATLPEGEEEAILTWLARVAESLKSR